MQSRVSRVLLLCISLLLPSVAQSAVFVCHAGDTGCLRASIAKSK